MTREEVKEIILSHSPCKAYEDSTLERFTKSQLIELLKVAEHNWACEMAGNDQLMENIKDWEPVKHAHWEHFRVETDVQIFSNVKSRVVDSGWRCSDCKTPIGFSCNCENHKPTEKYCSECGAKMDEVVEDGKCGKQEKKKRSGNI